MAEYPAYGAGLRLLGLDGLLDKTYRPRPASSNPAVIDGDDFRGANGLAVPRTTFAGVVYTDAPSVPGAGASAIDAKQLVWGTTTGATGNPTAGSSYLTATLTSVPDEIAACGQFSSKNYLGQPATTDGAISAIICTNNPGGYTTGVDMITKPGGGAIHCSIFGASVWSIGYFSSRTRTVTGSSASPTITDAAIGADETGRAVRGNNIPANSFVGSGANAPTVGVSWTLVNNLGVPINPTGAVTSVQINIGYTTLTIAGSSATGSFDPPLPYDTLLTYSVTRVNNRLEVRLPNGAKVTTDDNPIISTLWGPTVIWEPANFPSNFAGLTKLTAAGGTALSALSTLPLASAASWHNGPGAGVVVIRLADVVTGSAASSTIANTNSLAADAGMEAVGTNVPANTFVGSGANAPTPGVSTILVDATNTPVLPTGAVTSLQIRAPFTFPGVTGLNVGPVSYPGLDPTAVVPANAAVWNVTNYATDHQVRIDGWMAYGYGIPAVLSAVGPIAVTTSPQRPFGFFIAGAPNMMPGMATGTSFAVVALNSAHYSKPLSDGPATVGHINLAIATPSGNIQVVICRGAVGSAPTSTRAASAIIPCPAAGFAQIPLGAAVALDHTMDWYGLWADNVTAKFFGSGGTAYIVATQASFARQSALAAGIPANPFGAGGMSFYFQGPTPFMEAVA
jgi:hypothetical protein